VLRQGERLVATARNVSTLDGLSQLAAAGAEQQLLTVKLDVTDQAQVEDAFAQAVARFGRIDVVVNNAGYGLLGEFESLSDDDIRALLDVNLWGVIRVTRAALRVFREVNRQPVGGRLLQISSIGGFAASQAISGYSASKFAVEGLSESIQRELKPEWNIAVTIVQPGGFKSDWAGRSMVTTEPHPAYEGSPAAGVRAFMKSPDALRSVVQAGDPERAAEAMIAVSRAAKPPLKLLLGADAVSLAESKLAQLQAELAQWRELSTSVSSTPEQSFTLDDYTMLTSAAAAKKE
jgi:NAD(P)-dependent dehydrogenase (short-subunit alcohol dehydrogenase family)